MDAKEAQYMKIGIVTCNRLSFTKKTIASIKRTAPNMEIYVIDNASTDGTRDWLKKLDLHVRFKDINIGAANAKNELVNWIDDTRIVLSDNDIVFKKGWHARVEKALTQKGVAVVGMWMHPLTKSLSGCCWAIKKQSWEELGGMLSTKKLQYNEDKYIGNEDTQFIGKLRKAKLRVVYAGDLVDHIGHKTTLGGWAEGSDGEKWIKAKEGIELEPIDDSNYHHLLGWRNAHYDKFKQKRIFTSKEHDNWYKNVYKNKQNLGEEIMYIIKAGSELVGSFGFTNIKNNQAEICRVVSNPKHEGKGFMNETMRGAIIDMTTIGVERLYLDVLQDNTRAINFYIKLGFKKYKRGKDSVYMELWLNQE